jgi:hypothetical protein
MKLGAGVFGGIRLQLGMADRTHVLDILTLVQSDFLSRNILNMPDTTVSELIPFHLEIAKHFLKFLDNMKNRFSSTGKFKVINMFGHKNPNFPIAQRVLDMIKAKLWVNRTGHQPTFAFGDLTEFHAEGSGRINEASARLVAMKDLSLRIEGLKAW